MRGDPLQGLGGGGMGVSPRQTLHLPPFHANLTLMQHGSGCRFSEGRLYVHSKRTLG
jgi:hypothetical protein